MNQSQLLELREISYECLLSLATDEGITASGKDEVFGCIFGRDSFITCLKIMRALKTHPDNDLLAICRRTLLTHISLQGKEFNIESGEQPGKFIHEYRVSNYERLTKLSRPWYIYPDQKIRNYDSLDATPLALIAMYRYWKQTNDAAFLIEILPSVEKGLNWMISHGDMDKDMLLEYELPHQRKAGGLSVQSWTDSPESLLDTSGRFPVYPIAPVEVQAFAWLAFRLWADFYTTTYAEEHSSKFGYKLLHHAQQMKDRFNKTFIMKKDENIYFAQALNGYKQQISTITANPLICLWAAYQNDNERESIIDDQYLEAVVKRAFEPDMFSPMAGIRTMSNSASTYDAEVSSYHNGSFWPMLNGLIVEGLENFNLNAYSEKLSQAMLPPLYHFRSPIELYIEKNGSYLPFSNSEGQQSCMRQAWSAAAAYDLVTNILN